MNLALLGAHRGIVLVLVLFVLLGMVYSVTTPLFEAPDEQWHFAFVQYVATQHELPVQTAGTPTHLARQEGSQPPLYYLLAAAATFWVDTSDYPGIVWENPHYGYNVPGVVNDNKNLFIHTSLESFPYHGAASPLLAVHCGRHAGCDGFCARVWRGRQVVEPARQCACAGHLPARRVGNGRSCGR